MSLIRAARALLAFVSVAGATSGCETPVGSFFAKGGLAGSLGEVLESRAGASSSRADLMAQEAAPPLFVTSGKPVTVDCEERATWNVMSVGLVGSVSAARCADAARMAQATEDALSDPQLMAQVARGAAELPALALVRETLSDGSTLAYFPVIAVDHGIVVLWTATMVDRTRSHALVVHATTLGCPESKRADTPRLRTETKGTVLAVARTLAAAPH